jgi:hypothetical protein
MEAPAAESVALEAARSAADGAEVNASIPDPLLIKGESVPASNDSGTAHADVKPEPSGDLPEGPPHSSAQSVAPPIVGDAAYNGKYRCDSDVRLVSRCGSQPCIVATS